MSHNQVYLSNKLFYPRITLIRASIDPVGQVVICDKLCIDIFVIEIRESFRRKLKAGL